MNLGYVKNIAKNKILELENNIDFLRTNKSNTELIKKQIELYSMWHSILFCIKYNQIISPRMITTIEKELAVQEIGNLNAIKILELIDVHNESVANESMDITAEETKSAFMDLLDYTFEEIPDEYNPNSNNLDTIVEYTIALFDNNSLSTASEAINLDEVYSPEDLVYVYSKVLKHYQNELIEFIEMLKESDFAFSTEMFRNLKDDYAKIYNIYLYFQDKYYISIDICNEDEEIAEVTTKQRKLYYSSNSNDPQKCYFVRDLIGLREEVLGQVKELIDEFKAGSNKHYKKLLDATIKGYSELKGDQIRIVLKRIKDEEYSVVGAFIKKVHYDRAAYISMGGRPIAKIDDDYSAAVETYYNEYIENNARKGSR